MLSNLLRICVAFLEETLHSLAKHLCSLTEVLCFGFLVIQYFAFSHKTIAFPTETLCSCAHAKYRFSITKLLQANTTFL